jgi:hypothetical protein
MPSNSLVIDAKRFEPAGSWPTFDGWRPPHTRLDKRPARGEIHDLSRADAQHGVQASLDEEGEMRIGTQAPIGDQHIPCLQTRMDRLHLGQVVSHEGRDHQLQEHPYTLLTRKEPYQDLGATYFDTLDQHRVERRLVRRLERLGYRVSLQPSMA